MKKAVLFLLFVVFIDDVLVAWPSYGNGGYVREGSDDLEGPYVWCFDSKTIKGLNGDWRFYCSDNPKCLHYSPSGYVNNNSTGKINYVCPRGGYIAATRAYYQDLGVDRHFKVFCCHDNQTKSHEDCYWSGWQNCFGSIFRFWVPDGYYMAGIRSEYNSLVKNWYSRIWDFYVCK